MTPKQAIALLRLLDFVVLLVEKAPAIRAEYAARRATLERILSEERNPTAEEWKELNDSIHNLTQRLEAAVPLRFERD